MASAMAWDASSGPRVVRLRWWFQASSPALCSVLGPGPLAIHKQPGPSLEDVLGPFLGGLPKGSQAVRGVCATCKGVGQSFYGGLFDSPETEGRAQLKGPVCRVGGPGLGIYLHAQSLGPGCHGLS